MKQFIVILLFFITACHSFDDEPKYNTEIVCPNSSYRFLVLRATKKEVEKSIIDAIDYHQKSNKRNKYTILYFPDKSNTSIYNIIPEEVQRDCTLIERPRKLKDIN